MNHAADPLNTLPSAGAHSPADPGLVRLLQLCRERFRAERAWLCLPGSDRVATSPELDTRHDNAFCDRVLASRAILTEASKRIGVPVPGPDGYQGVVCLEGIEGGPGTVSPIVLAEYALLAAELLKQEEKVVLQKRVQDQQARFQAIFNSVIDGILTIDERGIIHTANPAAQNLFGYTLEEMLGCNVSMLMPEPYASEHDGYLENHRRTGRRNIIGVGREVEGLRKDGSVFPLELAVTKMRIGERNKFVGIVRDITERKHMEHMKSEFVSMVSHELRTPLTSIRGALSLVLGKASEGMSDKARQLLQTASRNSERLTLLINDILDLEKIQSGALDFRLGAEDLVALARQAIAANETYAIQHRVSLALVNAPAIAAAYVDADRVQQVFSNLISNAVKYSPVNGVVELAVSASPGGWRVSVRDHGPGIPENFRSRIFQRFSQADSSSRRVQGGTGLGLSISKAIVERLGGSIGYVSTVGEGAEFHFELPAWVEMREAPLAAENSRGAALPLLLCEDNADVAMVLAELLALEGFGCDIAATGRAAFTLLGRKRYAALLLDLTLPDMDGLVLLRELRDTPEYYDLPIIVVSGRAGEGEASWSGDGVAVIDWLQKPVDRERLARALSQVRRWAVRPRILHIEDEPDIIQVTQALLEDEADYVYATSLAQARRHLADSAFDLVLLDLNLPDGSGLDILDCIGQQTPVVVFSGREPGDAVSSRVQAALTKSGTSHERLLQTIRQLAAAALIPGRASP